MTAALVSSGASLAAERLRWRHSAAARLPLLGLAAASVQGLLYLAGSTRRSWDALGSWQILWVSFLGPVAVGLLAGLLGKREQDARGGGAWWRPITAFKAHVAQFLVMAGYALGLQIFVLFATLPYGWIDGLPFPGPVGTLAGLALVQWCATLSLLAIAHHLALRWGLFAATGLGLAWAITGTLTAEGGWWWVQPWAWSVRAALPIIGTHANGVPLAPGETLPASWVWQPALLSCMTAVAVVWLAKAYAHPPAAHERPGLGRRTIARYASDGRWRTGEWAALLHSMRRTALVPLILATLLTIVAGLVLWSDPRITLQLLGLVVAPVGTALLPLLVWHWTAPAWRALALRPTGPERLVDVLLALMGLCLAGLAGFATAALMLAGLAPVTALTFGLLSITTGWMLICWHFWLVLRTGVGVAVASGSVGALVGLVVGGTGLAGTLWPFAPWTWTITALSGHRSLVVVPICLVLCIPLGIACRSAGRRAPGGA